MSQELTESQPLIQENEDIKQKSFYQRHKTAIICSVVTVLIIVLLILLAVFAVPPIAQNMVQKYLDEIEIEILEVEMISQNGNKGVCRVESIMRYNAPLEVDGVSEPTVLELYLENPANLSELWLAGTIDVPSLRATGTETYLNVTTTFEMLNDSAIHAVFGHFITSERVRLWGKGELVLTAHLPLYSDMTFTGNIWSGAYIKGLADMDFTLNYMDLVSTTEDEVSIDFDLLLHNPSIVSASYSLDVYACNLGIYYNSTWVGYGDPTSIFPGKGASPNRIPGTLVRTPENEAAIAEFLSRYILGDDIDIYIEGTAKVDLGLGRSEENPAYVFVRWLLPGIKDTLIRDIFCPLREIRYFPRLILTAVGEMMNPLEFPVQLLEVTFDAFVGDPCNETVGTVNEEFYDQPFEFPSKVPVCLGGMELRVTLADVSCMLSGGVLGDIILYAQKGSMVMSVESFVIRVPFEYGPIIGRIGQCEV